MQQQYIQGFKISLIIPNMNLQVLEMVKILTFKRVTLYFLNIFDPEEQLLGKYLSFKLLSKVIFFITEASLWI